MKKLNSFFTASVWYIFANVIAQGIMLLSNVIFTHVMPQNDYGLYSTYYSVVSLIAPFVGCNLFWGLCNGYIDFKDDRKNFRASLFFLSIIVFLAFSLIFIGASRIYNFFAKTKLTYFVVLMALLHAYSFFVVNFFMNYQNMENNYKSKSFFMIAQNVFQIVFALLLIFVVAKNSYYERVLGSAFGVFVCALICALIMLVGRYKLVNLDYWRYSLKISAPSVLSSVSSLIMHQSDHIMITFFCGASFTAVYSLVYLVGNAIVAILSAIRAVLQSWLYRLLDSLHSGDIYTIQKWYLLFFVFVSYALLMVSPEIIKFLAPETYWDFRFIPPFVAGTSLTVVSSLYNTVGQFYKKTGALSANVFIAAIINVVLNIIFIKIFGSLAAAYTSLVSYFVLVVLDRHVSEKLREKFFSDKHCLGYLFAIFFGCILFMFVSDEILFRYISYSFLLLLIMVYVFAKRKELVTILKSRSE